MQALNKAHFTEANVRLTLLEPRKKGSKVRTEHRLEQLLLFSQSSRALTQCCRSSCGTAGSGKQHCCPCPETSPLLTQSKPGHQRSCKVKDKQKCGEHFCITDVKVERLIRRTERFSWCFFPNVFFQMWSKLLICTQKKR